MITGEPFGTTRAGAPVERYVLSSGGIRAAVITYGAALQMLETPDADGSVSDIAPGFGEIAAYENHNARFGAIIGRTVGRVRGGIAHIGGRSCQLSLSGGEHHLHGGFEGYDRRIWKAVAASNTLELRLDDKAAEGYPGNVEATVRYRLEESSLIIEWEALSDADTLCNMTTHAYWNLAGHASGEALGHYLQIQAGRVVELDAQALPTGRILPVEGTGADFNRWRCLRDPRDWNRPRQASGCYLPDLSPDMPAAQLWEPVTGRWMRLYTDQPALHYYSGYLVRNLPPGKDGAAYKAHCGVCLEPLAVSDGINHPGLPSPLLKKGEPYRRYVKYEFLASSIPPWEL